MRIRFSNFKLKILVVFISVTACAQTNKKEITLVNFDALEKEKTEIFTKGSQHKEEYKKLIEQADALLKQPPFSVVHKTTIPPSNTKHDYVSIGPYWWPNSKTKNGLPYVRKDGEVNPETRGKSTDFIEKKKFIDAVEVLTKAFFLSGDNKYAKKNLEFLQAWFLNERTKMNPNLNFAQYVPGKSEGRCFGIIEFANIIEVIKFLEIAKYKEVLDHETEIGMMQWFTSYSNWLQNSKLGQEESSRKNNHGTHYDSQLLHILLYLKKYKEVKEYLLTVTKNRIYTQIKPDGSQPLELARTKSFSYSAMNLHGFLELAILSKKVGVDFWKISSSDGRSIKKGYQYMIPYLTNQKEWEYKQIKSKKQSIERLISDLKYISKNFNDTSFDATLEQVAKIN